MMRAYVDSLAAHAKDHIISRGQWDELMAVEQTPRPVTSTAYYYQFATILSRQLDAA